MAESSRLRFNRDFSAPYGVAEPLSPLVARVPYGGLAAAAVGLLPRHARAELRLPRLPVTEATLVRAGGEVLTRTIRWAMAAPAE